MKGVEMPEVNVTDVTTANTDVEADKPKVYDEKAYKDVVSESIQRRKKVDELELKLKKIEDEKLSDIEKKDKRVKELEDELTATKGNIKLKEIDSFIVEAISDKNVVDKAVMKILVKGELSSEEEITDKVVQKVVDKLLKDKPFLVNSTNVNPSDGNFKKQDSNVGKASLEQLNAFISGKTDKLS
jgi:hypothetical protein